MSSEPPPPGLVEALHNLLGGAGTTLLGSFLGRLMAYADDVKTKRRPLLSKAIIWEVPIVVGMGIAGEAICQYFQLEGAVRVGTVSLVAYYGPRYLARKIESRFSKEG